MTKAVERREARLRRAEGQSIVAIARDLAVARSSVSVWVRDVVRPQVVVERAESPRQPDDDGVRRSCGRCREDLAPSAFNRMGEGLQHWCRDCFKQYQRGRREAHRTQVARASERRRARARGQLLAYLDGRMCVDCGDHDLVVLELDHVLGRKAGDIALMVHHGAPEERLAEELAKCVVVCASCHRVRTATRASAFRVLGEQCASWPQKSPSQRRAMRFVLNELCARECVDCGERRLPCLDFDHLRDKAMTVARLVQQGAANSRLEAEIEKCEVRRASCHRRRTEWARRSWETRLSNLGDHHGEYPQRDSNSRSLA